jgi:DNA-directed RNA polymerase specialized sigma24 family protein
MASEGSVSSWIGQLQAGEPAAAQKLWESYFQRLVALARRKLQGTPRRAADEEDVALSAFDSFCRGAARGQFPQLQDRNDLWRLLVVITARKALALTRHENRRKRGGGAVLDEAAIPGGRDSSANLAGLEHIVGREPSPEFAAQVAEECSRLLALLNKPELRTVAVCKMEGYSIDEIAAKLGCNARTVDRKLWIIRNLWEQELPP